MSLPGPLHGEHLIAEISKADVFVNTSTIEGYLLTLVEAQALGLPVLMYDLPWLDVVRENDGLITVPQGIALVSLEHWKSSLVHRIASRA